MEQQVLSISLSQYKKEIDSLRASLLQLEKGSEEYANTVNEIKSKQQSLNEVMAIGKKDTDALDGSYNALQQQMTALKKEWKATNDEARRNELGQQISALDEQLKGLDASVGQFQRNVGNYAIAGESMKSQLKATKEEMAQLLAQGVAPTDERLQKLTETAGKLEDAMGDANAMIKQAASDTSALATMVDVAKTGTAVFGAWQGAMSAFGIESEETTKAIQRLQGIMTMLNSLQTIQTALVDKSSATYQLWNKALAAVGLTTKSTAKATQELTATQQANTVATGAATVATNLFKKALLATGIGAIVVLLGTLIAHWDKVTSAIRSVIGATDDYTEANEELEKSIDSVNHQTDNEIKIMKAQGASEKEIIAYKQKKIAAQIKEVEAKIADIQATNAQIQEGNKWYKAVTKIVNGTLKTISWAFQPILFAFDKIFGTKSLDGFNNMLKKAATSVADFAFGVKSNNKEIEELNGTLEKLKQNQVDLTYDFQAAEIADKKKTNSTKTHTNAEKDLNKALEEEIDLLKRNAAAIDNKISHANKLKKLKGQLTDLEALKEEEAYYRRQIDLWQRIAARYDEQRKKYKEGSKERIEYEKKYQEAVKQVTLNTQGVEIKNIEIVNKTRELALQKAEQRYATYIDEVTRKAESAITRINYEYDALSRGFEITIPPFDKNVTYFITSGLNEVFETLPEDIDPRDALSKMYNELLNESDTYWKELTQGEKDYTSELLDLEKVREALLYTERQSAREKEIEAVHMYYDDQIKLIQQGPNWEAEADKLEAEEKIRINQIKMEADADYAEHNIKMVDLIQSRKKQDLKNHKDWVKAQIAGYDQLTRATGDLLGSISDVMMENLKQRDDLSQEEAEAEFERIKKVQMAQVWVNTIAGAAGGFLNALSSYAPPFSFIIGGIAAATAIAAGVAQHKQIAQSTFDSAAAGSGGATVPEVQDIQVAPLLNEQADAGQMTALNTEALANQSTEQRVYIQQSDITKSNKQVEVRQSTTKF